MKLSKSKIKEKSYQEDGSTTQYLWADNPPGFGVRLNPGGSKTYIISFRTNSGRKQIVKIGRFDGAYTLDEARTEARRILVKAKDGETNFGSKKSREASVSIKHLVNEYIEKYSKVRRKTWQQDERRLTKHVLSNWGDWSATELDRGDVASLHRDIGVNAKVEANKVIGVIQTMYNFASSEGLVPEDFNPAKKVQKYPESRGRKRYLRKSEVPLLDNSLREEKNPFIIAIFWVYLLTGTRKSELLEATWGDVDFRLKELFLPETKNGSDHRVPLASHTIAILDALPEIDGNPYIFPGRKRGEPLSNVYDAWRRIRQRANLADVTIHDLRRTAASWLARMGVPDSKIKLFLNHRTRSVTGRYVRLEPSDIEDEVESYASLLLSQVETDIPNLVEQTVRNHQAVIQGGGRVTL
jgi:integrase